MTCMLWLFGVFLLELIIFNDKVAGNSCYPYNATFTKVNNTFQAPNVTRDQWWCTADRFYGWLGYVRDLKGETCDDPVYSLARIRQDFKKMADDGAKMVRIYGPICDQAFVWDNIVQAAAENNLGILGIVWHGYDDEEISHWRQREASLLEVLRKPLGRYVIHSVSFGSEPLYSWSISDIYVSELLKLKAELQQLNIPITVSEMKYGYDIAPPATREAVIKNIDFISAHIMPYYGTCHWPADVWPDITQGIDDFRKMIPGKQMMITQNPWGSNKNGRNRGSNCGNDVWRGVSVEGANQYWNLWTSNCQYFKQQQIGWFAHVFSANSEYNFGIYGPRSDDNPYPYSIDFHRIFC